MKRLTAELIAYDKSRNFWTLARNDVIMKLAAPQKNEVVMDVGCGSGILTKQLLQQGYKVVSIDGDKDAVAYTKKVNKETYFVDITKKIRVRQKAEVLVLADVIEHIKDDDAAVKSVADFMRPDDRLVISVPALQFFWTKNDEVRFHFRRYSKKGLRSLVEKHGLRVQKMRYWNMAGIPAIVWQKLTGTYVNYVAMSESRMNKFLLQYFLKVENKLPVPVGLSLLCVAVKK